MKTFFLVFYSFTLFISSFHPLHADESFISERVTFTSHNPFSFSDVINSYEKLKKQETELIAKKNVLSESEFQSSVKKLKLKIKEYNL